MKKAADIILNCLNEQGMSQRQLATVMGEKVQNINQQLNRQNDLKVERFIDVLEHIGYRVWIVENDGIRKVSPDYALNILETCKPAGLFWFEEDGGYYGINSLIAPPWIDEFKTKKDCLEWLKEFAV